MGIPYGKHRPLIRELGYFCKELITLLWWEDAIDEGLDLVPNATQRPLESARQATNSVRHAGCDCCCLFVEGGARLLARDEGKSEQSQESGREDMIENYEVVCCKTPHVLRRRVVICVPPTKSRLSKPACAGDLDLAASLSASETSSRQSNGPKWLRVAVISPFSLGDFSNPLIPTLCFGVESCYDT